MDYAILIQKNHPHEIDTLGIFHTAKWVRNDAHNVTFLVLFDIQSEAPMDDKIIMSLFRFSKFVIAFNHEKFQILIWIFLVYNYLIIKSITMLITRKSETQHIY